MTAMSNSSDSSPSTSSCCAPLRRSVPVGAVPSTNSSIENQSTIPEKTACSSGHRVAQAYVPAGTYMMGNGLGDEVPGDGENPVHEVILEPFAIDATTVTVADFAHFAEATGYRTEAERFGFSAVFHLAVRAPSSAVLGAASGLPWWITVRGADWAHPDGPNSSTEGREDHPVVHISWNDAQAYCRWAGRRLPTEAEWEAASRGGSVARRFPWGDKFDATRMNVWLGRFPDSPSPAKQNLTTVPADSYAPNGFGLKQTVGNVWEWCHDWFDPGYYTKSPRHCPEGPPAGTSKVMRGGSYLCHASYCYRFRNAARSSNTPDSSTGNLGFRTVASIPQEEA